MLHTFQRQELAHTAAEILQLDPYKSKFPGNFLQNIPIKIKLIDQTESINMILSYTRVKYKLILLDFSAQNWNFQVKTICNQFHSKNLKVCHKSMMF